MATYYPPPAPTAAPPPPLSPLPPLPPGWTEHKAPTGHSYYYNAETKTSTYKRPLPPQVPQAYPQTFPRFETPSYIPQNGFPAPYMPSHQDSFSQDRRMANYPSRRGNFHHSGQRRSEPQDRPKHRHVIPNCAPWVLVKTKLGRRFVHNTQTGESLWKFPEDVMKAVVEFDKRERERKERIARGEDPEDDVDEERAAAEELASQDVEMENAGSKVVPIQGQDEELASDEEYEEVEVTDDEAEEDEGHESKRQRTEEPPQDQRVEFGEEDIAWQLEAMGADYGLDPGEYGIEGQGDYPEGAEGLPLTDEDAKALFMDLLDDFHISPFSTFDKVIEEGHIIDDDRYTALPNMRARRETWDEWARIRIQQLKEAREKMEKRDPKIPYLAFLAKNATPKLYWPEFKRKYRKEPEMKDTKLSDKDREKLYRDHINRLKLPQSQLKSDLSALMRSLPVTVLNRSTQLAALPPQLLTDLRFYSLPEKTRNSLVETYVSTLPPPPEPTDLSAEDEAAAAEKKKERERREQALKERERMVEEERRRQDRDLRIGKARLREGEREVEEAMRVGNRFGGAARGGDEDGEV